VGSKNRNLTNVHILHLLHISCSIREYYKIRVYAIDNHSSYVRTIDTTSSASNYTVVPVLSNVSRICLAINVTSHSVIQRISLSMYCTNITVRKRTLLPDRGCSTERRNRLSYRVSSCQTISLFARFTSSRLRSSCHPSSRTCLA